MSLGKGQVIDLVDCGVVEAARRLRECENDKYVSQTVLQSAALSSSIVRLLTLKVTDLRTQRRRNAVRKAGAEPLSPQTGVSPWHISCRTLSYQHCDIYISMVHLKESLQR